GLAAAAPEVLREHPGSNGPFVLAIDVEVFAPLDEFLARVGAQAAKITESVPADGFNQVLLPGEPEIENRRRREIDGIPVPERTWDELRARAIELGVAVPA